MEKYPETLDKNLTENKSIIEDYIINNVGGDEQHFKYVGDRDPKTGLPSGKGELYFLKSKRLYYGGDFKYGLPNTGISCCKIYYDRGEACGGCLRYRGHIVDGARDGFGVEFMPCGNVSYLGNFLDNYYDSFIGSYYCMTNGKCTHKGQFRREKKEGFGISYHDNGQIK